VREMDRRGLPALEDDPEKRLRRNDDSKIKSSRASRHPLANAIASSRRSSPQKISVPTAKLGAPKMPSLRAASVASECLERRGRLQADQHLLGVAVRQAAMNDLDAEPWQVRGRGCRVDLTASCSALELRHRSPPSGRRMPRQSQSTRRGDLLDSGDDDRGTHKKS